MNWKHLQSATSAAPESIRAASRAPKTLMRRKNSIAQKPTNGSDRCRMKIIWLPLKGQRMKFQNQAICRRCNRPMESVATIPPVGRSPGLIAFLCSGCGAADSVLVDPAKEGRQHGADLAVRYR